MLRSIVSFAEIVVIAACFVLPARAPAELTAVASRKGVPDFTLDDSTGNPIKLSAYKGKVVLLDFWATWCHGCMEEIPWYIEFQKKYKGSGLAAVGVAMDEEGWPVVKPFLAQSKINYTIVVGNSDLATRFGVTGMPVTLLIDRNGKIADTQTGVVDKDVFEKEIQILLKEPAAKKDSK